MIAINEATTGQQRGSHAVEEVRVGDHRPRRLQATDRLTRSSAMTHAWPVLRAPVHVPVVVR